MEKQMVTHQETALARSSKQPRRALVGGEHDVGVGDDHALRLARRVGQLAAQHRVGRAQRRQRRQARRIARLDLRVAPLVEQPAQARDGEECGRVRLRARVRALSARLAVVPCYLVLKSSVTSLQSAKSAAKHTTACKICTPGHQGPGKAGCERPLLHHAHA